MKKVLFLLLVGFLLSHVKASAQCQCQGQTINPQDAWNENDNNYNQAGQVTSYNYNFQFACIDAPCDATNQNDEYEYIILYRKAGSNDPWTEVTSSVWDDIQDFTVSVPGLIPGIKYEFTISCPCSAFCDPYAQIESFYNGNPLFNVMDQWDRVYCPLNWVESMDVMKIEQEGTQATINWTYSVLPPGDVSVSYRPVTIPNSSWTDLGTTSKTIYTLSGLTPCTEYEFRITLPVSCTTKTKTIKFKTGDCSATISDISDINGVSAEVKWRSNSALPPSNFTLKWWKPGSTPISITTNNTNYKITGLTPSTRYNVQVIPNCSAAAQCPTNSNQWQFTTYCDPYGDNSSFENAAAIAFDNTIHAGGEGTHTDDYYSFVATCERIKVYIDHPDLHISNGEFGEVTAEMNYEIYDDDFNLVPRTTYYNNPLSGNDIYAKYYHAVNPGHTYYLKVKKESYTDLDFLKKCYYVTLKPCLDCFENRSNIIDGIEEIEGGLPQQSFYNLILPFYFTTVNWTIVSGDADIFYSDGTQAMLSFDKPGSVLLAANVTRCDGAQMTYYKTIKVFPADCTVNGTVVTNTQEGLPLEGFNQPDDSNYFIFLDIPEGTSFSWSLFSGDAQFETETIGNLNFIEVFQTSTIAIFGLTVEIDGCMNTSSSYAFEIGDHFTGGGEEEFRISPNPVTDILTVQYTPRLNIGLENEGNVTLEILNSNLVSLQSKQTDINSEMKMNCSSLIPGNYFIRIIQNDKLTTLPFFKI